jgi:hypothetical protein
VRPLLGEALDANAAQSLYQEPNRTIGKPQHLQNIPGHADPMQIIRSGSVDLGVLLKE